MQSMQSKYDLKKVIGEGNFGKVRLVNAKKDGNAYVMKEIRLIDMTPKETQQALTEVKVLSKCRHKNIIRYVDSALDREKGQLLIVMEYAENGDLNSAIEAQKGTYFHENVVLSWFVQITLALQYIHIRNILHRDLATKNIFLTKDKLVKLGDFGIARVLKKDQELAKTPIGTPYYISPEIVMRKPYNCKSDIWALGCVLFEMAALKRPFQAPDLQHLAFYILSRAIGTLPDHCSPLIKHLVSILLNSDPNNRPTTEEILIVPALQEHMTVYCTRFGVRSQHAVNRINCLKVDGQKNGLNRKIYIPPDRRSSLPLIQSGSVIQRHHEKFESANEKSPEGNQTFTVNIPHGGPLYKTRTMVFEKELPSKLINRPTNFSIEIPPVEQRNTYVLPSKHLFETLWASRIKSSNRSAKNELESKLCSLLGPVKFKYVCRTLKRAWLDDTSVERLVDDILETHQMQYLPLLIQYVQLDMISV